MEVVDKNHALLSNHEVLNHLRDIQNGTNDQKKPGRNQQNLATVCYSTVKFLEQTPAVSQTNEVIEGFMQVLNLILPSYIILCLYFRKWNPLV